MAPSNSRKPSKAERTAEARERARLQREAAERTARRNSLLIRWGVVAAAVVIAVVIALVVAGNIRGRVPDAGPAPQHGNDQGGITLVSTSELAETEVGEVDVASLPEEPAPGAVLPPGVEPASDGAPIPVVAYVDVNCVHCSNFENEYADDLRRWLNAGDITLEYRNVAYLDRNSRDDYSSRGASALACVADTAPDSYFDFATALFANFESGELDDGGLVDMAAEVGAGDISTCLSEGTFRPWAKYATEAAQAAGIEGTPTVYVDGEEVPDAVADFGKVVEEKLG
ncbi:thioredoxin domain-containing protein [uncultured Arthrobacter sp.]|uniref:DsbA family protein n=1 Tax=uncultured Arthrobacter sp. TaxID=114050 RepID=UPI0025FC492B|nr:thioredoxin domain-containing protein [uncultured Arthrobacter sp.]